MDCPVCICYFHQNCTPVCKPGTQIHHYSIDSSDRHTKWAESRSRHSLLRSIVSLSCICLTSNTLHNCRRSIHLLIDIFRLLLKLSTRGCTSYKCLSSNTRGIETRRKSRACITHLGGSTRMDRYPQ